MENKQIRPMGKQKMAHKTPTHVKCDLNTPFWEKGQQQVR